MRWDSLLIDSADAGDAQPLPGYREPALVRTFDAPEALNTRFYEVRAKSALNRVPEKSKMPFRWTINPYRGCSHACVYCVSGDTPVLMADGRTRPISDLRVGDAIYGTERVGAYRRYVPTTVLAHWSTVKPAHRVTLEDGTELVASGDHRFLTGRGWKHVTGAMNGPDQRPYLTTNDVLLGTGRFATGPDKNAEYRRGYLCGMVRGDGSVGTYEYIRPGRGAGRVYRFRLALKDAAALHQSQDFLAAHGIRTDEFAFSAASARHAAITAIRTQKRASVESIERLVAWPGQATDDWAKGFLAGIFDAEGSCSGGVLRISNGDPTILGEIERCFDRFGFDHVTEPPRPNGCRCVRLRGGLAERLRFFHLADPVIMRKRDMAGHALKTAGARRVVSVEPMGVTLPMCDITTGTGDFIANGVVSHNCFARPTHQYLGFDAGRDFEQEIVVKVNAPEVLRAELRRPSWAREHVAIGTNTDPYQWVEGRYRLMPEIWQALLDAGTPCSVLTKSPLLLRDLALFQALAAGPGFTASLSIPTLDEKAWRATEPRTPNPKARIEALAALNAAGIPTGVLVAPLMPGVNDDPQQVQEILDRCHEAGATGISGIALHLRGETRGVFMEWLRSARPDLVPRYEELYHRSAYAPAAERQRIARLLSSETPDWPGPRGRGRLDLAPAPPPTPPPPPAAPQDSLF